ncbi:hypothetical protein [uncultured Pontibacter sp.]|uniref:hypothetical protein n=1 Tax=uncultured Pontibacter sp. TaxID=453356 RepID=UPI00262D9CDE|nr:hypothetical protein [uncultured Pontibacter sp.]
MLRSACLALIWLLNASILALAQPEQKYTFSSQTQAAFPIPYQSDLFDSEEVLQFTLLVDYKELLKDRGDERVYHKASIHYQTGTGQTTAIDLKVRVRGKHRRDPSVCRFPPLLLNFPKKAVANTVFAGTDKLKLVTHCIGEKYVIREYLVYKLYNELTHLSFRVRLCKIEYKDVEGNRKIGSNYAFLIEDEDEILKRNKGEKMPEELLIRMDATDDRTMAKLALFQYMIGNTDWSVPYRHNIKLLLLESYSKPVPVPYDFDYTGIVMPPYAKPPPEIGITSVRQRIFRGYSYPDDVLAELVPFFNNRKEAIYQVYKGNHLLDEKYRKQTLRYLDEFYETINKPKDFERQIVKAGQQNERSSVVVKGLD